MIYFRYPRNQFDQLFMGCYAVWGNEYRFIRYSTVQYSTYTVHYDLVIQERCIVLYKCSLFTLSKCTAGNGCSPGG